MAAKADGSVVINTRLDTTQFDKDIKNVGDKTDKLAERMSTAFKKVGAVIAAAFAVQKIVQFGKEAVAAAEIQEESERKLETVMRQRMGATNEMIQSVKDLCSAEQSLGVVGDEVQMAGAQQLATFLTTSEALKTLIPAMNDLAVQQNGVNVSFGSMVSIGNLMGKVMQGQVGALRRVGISFSEAEEQILKYGSEQKKAATLAKVITNNVGNMNDVIASTPAGQVQQLKNNFGDLLELLGMGIQNVVTPMVKVLNNVVMALQKAAIAFRDFTSMITGVDATRSPTGGSAVNTLDDATESTEDLTDAEEEEAKAKKKQEKEQKKYLSGLDEIRRFELEKKEEEDEEEEEKPNTFSGGEEAAEKIDTWLDKIKDKLKELADLFKKGFWDGLGDYAPRLQNLKDDIQSIKDSLKDIFTDPKVLSAVDHFAKTAAYALGQIVGSAASMGLTLAQNIVGGIENFLTQSKERIKQHLIAMFDIGSEIFALVGQYAKIFANIFEVYGSEVAQGILGDIFSIIYEVWAVVSETALKLIRDLIGLVTKPITDNAEKIKTAIMNTLTPLKTFWDGILTGVRTVANGILAIYDEHISPFITRVAEGISTIVGILADGYNQHVAPVLTKLANKFKEIMEGPFGKFINSVVGVIGAIIDNLGILWDGTLMPFFSWIAENIMPILAQIIDIVGTTLLTILEWLLEKLTLLNEWLLEHPTVLKIITGLLIVLAAIMAGPLVTCIVAVIGVGSLLYKNWETICEWAEKLRDWFIEHKDTITALAGVLALLVALIGGPFVAAIVAAVAVGVALWKNWETICEWAGNLKEKVGKAWDTVKTKVETTAGNILSNVQELKNKVSQRIETLRGTLSSKWSAIKDKASSTWNSIKSTAISKWEEIRGSITSKVAVIKSGLETKWEEIKNSISTKVGQIKSDLQTKWENIKTSLSIKWDAIKENAGKLGDKFIELKDGAFQTVSDFFSNTFGPAFEGIKDIGENIVNYFSGDFLKAWGDAWQGIVDKVGSIFGGLVNFVKDPINNAIDAVNDAIGWINDKLGGLWDKVRIPGFHLGPWDLGFLGTYEFGFDGIGLRDFSEPPHIDPIPRLASGAVIPPNAPFAAVLGDQRNGTNIEAPLDTIKQAVREVVGQKGNNTYRVSAEVGGRTILEIILDEAQMMRMQTGRNPFEMGW